MILIYKTYHNNKAVFTIMKDTVVLDIIEWNYLERDLFGLITDGGTRNCLMFASDSIYAIGQGWHYSPRIEHNRPTSVIIPYLNVPNAYFTDSEYNSTHYWDSLIYYPGSTFLMFNCFPYSELDGQIEY